MLNSHLSIRPSAFLLIFYKMISNFSEQDEKTRESTEQWRQFHHDGLDPPYEYNRHAV